MAFISAAASISECSIPSVCIFVSLFVNKGWLYSILSINSTYTTEDILNVSILFFLLSCYTVGGYGDYAIGTPNSCEKFIELIFESLCYAVGIICDTC